MVYSGTTHSPGRVDSSVEFNPGADSIEVTQLGPSHETIQHDVIDYLGSLREWLEHDARSRTQDLEAVVARIDQLDTRIDTLLPISADVPPSRSGNGVTDHGRARVDTVTESSGHTSPSIEIQAHRSRVPSPYQESSHGVPIIPTPIQLTARPNNEHDIRSNPLPTFPPHSPYTGYNVEPDASYRHLPPGAEQTPVPAPRPYVSTYSFIISVLRLTISAPDASLHRTTSACESNNYNRVHL